MISKLHINEMPDIEDNLLHFKDIECRVKFPKPHERKLIIKNANQMYKSGFKRFLSYISPYIQEREALRTKIKIAHAELKVLSAKLGFYDNDRFRNLYYKYGDFIKLERKGKEIPENENYSDFLKFKEEFKESLVWLDKEYKKNREWNILHDLLSKSEEQLKELGQYCFYMYNSISPLLSPFATNLHDIRTVLIANQIEDTVLELNNNDILPRKRTVWNSDRKLFSFLAARKKYWFECWRFLEKKGLCKPINPTCKCKITKGRIRSLLISLIKEGYVQVFHVAPSNVIYNVALYNSKTSMQYEPSFIWLKSLRDLAYLSSMLTSEGFLKDAYLQQLISDRYILNKDETGFSLSTYKIYIREFNTEDFAPPKNMVGLNKIIKCLKNEK